ncbi:hypothetical protein HD597_000350 [Nonomuraea thailandensis]|uniref:HEAT repeat domain-containing protein n=1 Tax=Nonomuraea thailandensis TaxID=1188745 RepID=A0A9X2G934_9ACTN|nr:HEAT repeat domain-containing protein [Nonomuraea thailandensis]MCP2353330.1 hypothetical protein [Nonomuraea thailandensis]
MFDGLYDIDWSSMEHAYGSAGEIPELMLALRSADRRERHQALEQYYSAVHHQGGVYPCTTASLPFLFELAGDPATPDRAAIVGLLVSIGTVAVEEAEQEYADLVDFAGAAAVMRARAQAFVAFAADADPLVRRRAVAGLGLFLDDADRALALLRERLAAEPGLTERLQVLNAAALLATRLPAAWAATLAWLADLATDPATNSAIDPGTRLAAVVHRARCAPEQIREETVAAVIELLRELQHELTPDETWWAEPPSRMSPADGTPPQVLAAFDDLDRRDRVHALTTDLLQTFHQALDARVPERTELLAQQSCSRDPGARLDAIRMSGELINTWRGDHGLLVELIARHLGPAGQEGPWLEVAAEAAAVLQLCHPIAEPAREVLAAYVLAQRTAHGPQVWATPRPRLARAHQQAVLALARLGDIRAVPSLLAALDSGADDWRAVQVAGCLPAAADQLVPRLCERLRRLDPGQSELRMHAGPVLSALAALGDRSALTLITDTLAATIRHKQWPTTCAVLHALAAFGPAAAPALTQIRPLTTAANPDVRSAAVAALWAVGRDTAEVLPLLHDLLDGDRVSWLWEAADVLAQIGPPAAATLPRLRELADDDYEWVSVHCATALWQISGETEAPAVLATLLRAWERNPSTGTHVVACLDRMGQAAEPALPMLRMQLALPRRIGRWEGIAEDEELQRAGRAIIGRCT